MHITKMLVAPVAFIATIVAYDVVDRIRHNRRMKALTAPLPPVGEDYLRQHRAMMSDPENVAALETIDTFVNGRPFYKF